MTRLRIVGIFYDQSFVVADGITIKDLLDIAVIDSKGNFSYTSTIKFKLQDDKPVACNSLFGFAHQIETGIFPSLGNKKRDDGYYKLFESTSVERESVTVHAWQYYVIRGGKVFSNFWDGVAPFPDVSPAKPAAPTKPTDPKPGFTPFDVIKINNDDEVVWRNVSIVRNPQTLPIYL
jgi:hypothetical protein